MNHTKKLWFKGKSISGSRMAPITDTTGTLIALVYNGERDGNLISAVPHMYEALKDLQEQIPVLYGDKVRDGLIDLRIEVDTIDQIVKALTRAEQGDGSTKEAAI